MNMLGIGKIDDLHTKIGTFGSLTSLPLACRKAY